MKTRFLISQIPSICHKPLVLLWLVWMVSLPRMGQAADLLDTAAADGRFSTLVNAVQVSGLRDLLKASPESGLTLFAPTDEAFAKLPPSTVAELIADPDRLRRVIQYHVVKRSLRSSELAGGPLLTVSGDNVQVSFSGGSIRLNDSRVVIADQVASNGMLHGIDALLVPPSNLLDVLAKKPEFSTLLQALRAAGADDLLASQGPFTVFAPNNAAFEKLPPGSLDALLQNPIKLKTTLLYHVLPGRVGSVELTAGSVVTAQGSQLTIGLDPVPTVNGNKVIAPDQTASNGVVHEIDGVLLPPPSILQRALADPQFSTLAAAVNAGGLAEILDEAGPYTLFAPNNAAFAKLPAGTLESLLADTSRLRSILLYHVVSGRVASKDLTAGPLRTVQGSSAIVLVDPVLTIDGAGIVTADLAAANGTVHVIDTVLIPPKDIPGMVQENPTLSTLAAAFQAAGLVDKLKAEGPFTLFAPSDEAFAKLPPNVLAGLLNDPDQLGQLLLYHVVPSRVDAANLKKGVLPTAFGGTGAMISLDPTPKINQSQIVITDIRAANGIIHVIDAVLEIPPTLGEIAGSDPSFSTFVSAVEKAGLSDLVLEPGSTTLFAPNNQAFAKLPSDTLTRLLANPAQLKTVLLYHLVSGRVRPDDLKQGKLRTLQGAAVQVDKTGGLKVNQAEVYLTDVEASNGVLYGIDSVILPPPTLGEVAASNPDFSTLATVVEAAGLSRLVLADRVTTLFAPNNAAFSKLPPGVLPSLLADTNQLRSILLYHMAKGRVRAADLKAGSLPTLQGAAVRVATNNGVSINGVKVIAADLEAGNGIIHVLDSVLQPPPPIAEIALSNPDFSTLVTAVKAAGLLELLQNNGPYTLFAPNNAAFAKLPAGTVEELLANPLRLRHILLYHLNHGPRLRSTDLKDGKILTLQGAQANIEVSESGVKINQASVIAADIEAFNGVIHVIDQVILPADGFSGVTVSTVVKEGKATVVWPLVNGADFKLESAPTVDGPWSPVDSVVITADGIQKTEVPTTAPQQFFRVRSEPVLPGE